MSSEIASSWVVSRIKACSEFNVLLVNRIFLISAKDPVAARSASAAVRESPNFIELLPHLTIVAVNFKAKHPRAETTVQMLLLRGFKLLSPFTSRLNESAMDKESLVYEFSLTNIAGFLPCLLMYLT